VRQNSLSVTPSSLVPIQPYGNKRPLFLVHPAGDMCSVHWLDAMSRSRTALLRAASQGVENGQEPHTTIEDMAACYVEAIQSVQSEGPYLLGGWSMGGR